MRKVIAATVSRRSVARRLASTAVMLSPPARALQPSWRRSAPGSGAVVEVAGAGAAAGASGRAMLRPATKARPATTRVAAARAIRSRGGAAGGAGAGSGGGRPGCWGSLGGVVQGGQGGLADRADGLARPDGVAAGAPGAHQRTAEVMAQAPRTTSSAWAWMTTLKAIGSLVVRVAVADRGQQVGRDRDDGRPAGPVDPGRQLGQAAVVGDQHPAPRGVEGGLLDLVEGLDGDRHPAAAVGRAGHPDAGAVLAGHLELAAGAVPAGGQPGGVVEVVGRPAAELLVDQGAADPLLDRPWPRSARAARRRPRPGGRAAGRARPRCRCRRRGPAGWRRWRSGPARPPAAGPCRRRRGSGGPPGR